MRLHRRLLRGRRCRLVEDCEAELQPTVKGTRQRVVIDGVRTLPICRGEAVAGE
jgi:hypothetical protein